MRSIPLTTVLPTAEGRWSSDVGEDRAGALEMEPRPWDMKEAQECSMGVRGHGQELLMDMPEVPRRAWAQKWVSAPWCLTIAWNPHLLSSQSSKPLMGLGILLGRPFPEHCCRAPSCAWGLGKRSGLGHPCRG